MRKNDIKKLITGLVLIVMHNSSVIFTLLPLFGLLYIGNFARKFNDQKLLLNSSFLLICLLLRIFFSLNKSSLFYYALSLIMTVLIMIIIYQIFILSIGLIAEIYQGHEPMMKQLLNALNKFLIVDAIATFVSSFPLFATVSSSNFAINLARLFMNPIFTLLLAILPLLLKYLFTKPYRDLVNQ